MTPIINPFTIYIIESLTSFHTFLHGLIFICGVGLIYNYASYVYTKDCAKDAYHSFLSEERHLQERIKERTSEVNTIFCQILYSLKEEFKDKTNIEKLQALETMAKNCCSRLSDIKHQTDDIAKDLKLYKEDLAINKKWGFRFLILVLALLIIELALPSTEVAYKMFIASQITPDNLEMVKSNSKEAIEWTIEAITKAIQSIGVK